LHLRPRSNSAQRVWQVGKAPSAPGDTGGSELRLAVVPGRYENFASLKSILEQLKRLSTPGQQPELDRLDGYLREACPDTSADGGGSHGRLLADSVAFAIMRRISRESFYTARVIELGARTINDILSRIPDCRRVHVGDVDRLDRPTLKVLARAALLLEPSHGFSWVWQSASDPTELPPVAADDLFVTSRRELLRQLVNILSPTLERHPGVEPLTRPEARPGKVAALDMASALVIQNYDACFLWSDSLAGGHGDAALAEAQRLQALAAVNISKYDEALRSLRRAEELSVAPGRRAHLAYLQGLIETKRHYDLSGSDSHYKRGLRALDAGPSGADEDIPLERAWLLNGLALNEAMLWRRNPRESECHAKAFAFERDAFALVSDGESPARTYLRFNLLANSAFLLEMRGNYQLAIDTFIKTFDFGLDERQGARRRWRSTLGYRVGVLHHRAGNHDEALELLRAAAEQDSHPESWPTLERVLCTLGRVLLDHGCYAQAADTFARGLELCRNGRSARGADEHGRHLILSLLSAGEKRRAREIYEELLAEESLGVVPPETFAAGDHVAEVPVAPLPPKLPAYFPELDLEGMPSVDLNLFLGNPAAQADGRTPSWSN
jgi:tetratricopeptide (TPR) repeat protein